MIRRGWLLTVAANVTLLITGATTGVLSARLLGPEQRGLLAAVTFWPTLAASFAVWSLPKALVARLSRSAVGPARLTASAGLVGLTIACLTFGLTAAGLPFLVGRARDEWLPLALAFSVLWIPVWVANSILVGSDQAQKRFGRVNLLRLGPSLFYLLAIAVCWLAQAMTVTAFVWAMAAASLLALGLRLAVAGKELLARPDRTEMYALFALGGRFHVATMLAVLSSQMDRLVLVVASGNAELGHYVVAWTFAASGLAAVTSAVSFVLMPVLASERERARALSLLALWLRRTALFLYVAVGVSLMVTPWILPLLFGRAFADAVPIALILLLAMIPLALRQTIIHCLSAFGEARVPAVSEVATILVFAVAAGPLLVIGGPIGVAVATLLAQIAGLFVCVRHLAGRHDIVPGTWLLPGREGLADALAIGRGLLTRVAG